jgi:hypothetical protein
MTDRSEFICPHCGDTGAATFSDRSLGKFGIHEIHVEFECLACGQLYFESVDGWKHTPKHDELLDILLHALDGIFDDMEEGLYFAKELKKDGERKIIHYVLKMYGDWTYRCWDKP